MTPPAAGEERKDALIPFLKWAGGKRWLVPQLEVLLPHGNGKYFEPFLGGGAAYFSIAPPHAVLSDTNDRLIETYVAIKRDYKRVYAKLEEHAKKHSDLYYYETRSVKFRNEFTRAAQFLYLNRTCWNGLYRVNYCGEFNVPRGTKNTVLLDSDNFEALSSRLASTELLCSDFELQIERSQAGDVVFADPPYTVKHKYNGFVKYNQVLFSWNDQVRLRDVLLRAKSRGVRVYLTNADHSSIRALYEKDFNIAEIKRYSVIAGQSSKRGQYSELLII